MVFGIGFGLVNAPITNTAVSGMPRSQAGVAAAIASTSRRSAPSLGVAVVGSLGALGAARVVEARLRRRQPRGWWIIAGCGVAILLVGLVTSGRWARGTAERTATSLMPASAGTGQHAGPA